jgi:uncharacterized protein
MAQAPGSGRTELLVVQPTTFCNIACTYCYLPERSARKRMDLRTVELLGSRVLRSGHLAAEASVVWHAGEPLVVPPGWYEDAFGILAGHCPPHVRLAHAVQTNGTLIDDAWIGLLTAHQVRIGVSLDGPRPLHDARRRTRHGRGTFDRTMAGIRALQAAGVPFHVITVLSAQSLARPDELFDFYLAEGIERVCFNIEEIEGVNTASSLATPGGEASFRAFLARFVERVAAAPRAIWVREVAGAVAAILASPAEALPNHQVKPLAILTVDVDGNLSTFSPELMGAPAPEFTDFRFVNLRTGGPEALLVAPGFARAHAAIEAGVEACRRTCAWFRWCGGGAPANKFFETGSLAATETLYCRLTKQAVMGVVLDAIEARRLPGVGGRA